MYVEELGAGPTILLISGLGGDSRAFAVLARWFARTHRVLALDNRDVGRSDRVAADYDTAERLLKRLLDV